MSDCSDPLEGWRLEEVEATSSGPASADIYGKLYYFVRGMLVSFLRRLSDTKASFRLFQVDVTELPRYLEETPFSTFSRIEVSTRPMILPWIPVAT